MGRNREQGCLHAEAVAAVLFRRSSWGVIWDGTVDDGRAPLVATTNLVHHGRDARCREFLLQAQVLVAADEEILCKGWCARVVI